MVFTVPSGAARRGGAWTSAVPAPSETSRGPDTPSGPPTLGTLRAGPSTAEGPSRSSRRTSFAVAAIPWAGRERRQTPRNPAVGGRRASLASPFEARSAFLRGHSDCLRPPARPPAADLLLHRGGIRLLRRGTPSDEPGQPRDPSQARGCPNPQGRRGLLGGGTFIAVSWAENKFNYRAFRDKPG